MSQPTDLTFRTKTGICTITPAEIVLARSSAGGAAAAALHGKSITRSLLIYSVLGAALFLSGLWFFARGSTVSGVILALIGAIFLWNVVASRKNSAAAVIPRAAIHRVEAHRPHPPLTRGYFDVYFLEDGEERRRVIMLPGSFADGEAEYERAEAVMRAADLLQLPAA